MKSFTFSALLCLLFVSTALSLDKQKDCKCRAQASKRIIGGHKAKNASIPWQVSVQLKEKLPGTKFLRKLVPDNEKIERHFCGGVILNERWILTVGHCIPEINFEPIPITSLRIGLGDNDLVKIFDEEKYAEIEDYVVPEGYGPILSKSEDVALIKLKKPLKFSKTVQPACLATVSQDVYEGALTLSGWGVTSHNRLTYQRSRFLRVAEVYDQSSTLEFCKVPEIDDPFEDYKDVVWNSLCTKNAKTNETGCDGDNGGPLHQQKGGKAIVIGLMKGAMDEELENEQVRACTGEAAFTPVAKTIDWIKEQIGDDFCA